MRFLFYKQPDSMDCGPSCLRMIAKYYGKEFALESLRKKTRIGKDGVSLLGIAEAAESIGFETQAVKLSITALMTEIQLPAILHWDQNHFVVLYKVKKKKLFVADPAIGLVTFSPNEFKPRWQSINEDEQEGIALLLKPSTEFIKNEGHKEPRHFAFRQIMQYIFPYRKLILQLFLGLGIGSLLQLLVPFITQSVVDTGINTGNLHFIVILLLAQMALTTGRFLIEFIRSWILLHISTRINIAILTDFLIKLMKLPISFFDSKKTGDILQRLNDHQRIESFLTGSAINVLFALINLFVFLFVLLIFNKFIFLVFIASALIYSFWVILFLKKRKDLDYKRFDVSSKEQSATVQLIQSMQEIKLNGIEKGMRWKWEGFQAKLFKLKMKSLALNQWQQTGALFINESKNIIITFLSAKAVIDGQMTLGSMVSVQFIVGQLNSPIEQMIGLIQSWQNAKISMDRLNEIYTLDDEEPAEKYLLQELPGSFVQKIPDNSFFPAIINEHKNGAQAKGQPVRAKQHIDQGEEVDTSIKESIFNVGNQPSIIFKDVSFTYPGAGNDPVLENINLQIPKGKVTAIIGLSGSGKTTLLKLLLRFYEPELGEIKVANVPLSEISHNVWRRYCGVVMQENYIFSDTIANNIAIEDQQVNKERLDRALETANLRDFIERLPLGLNTIIGAEGTGISMGQKQRILIARAVYRDPEFIFFDEATNSLDANNERIIMHNLESFLKNKTVIVVAHRLSTVKNADQIIVLHKGQIIERGTHGELIALKQEYFSLVKDQLELGV